MLWPYKEIRFSFKQFKVTQGQSNIVSDRQALIVVSKIKESGCYSKLNLTGTRDRKMCLVTGCMIRRSSLRQFQWTNHDPPEIISRL